MRLPIRKLLSFVMEIYPSCSASHAQWFVILNPTLCIHMKQTLRHDSLRPIPPAEVSDLRGHFSVQNLLGTLTPVLWFTHPELKG